MLTSVNDYINAGLVHSLHVSERKSFRGCRRRWHFIFRDLYYPLTTPKPLEFGIAYHEAAQHWYDPDTWGVDDKGREVETLQVFRNACLRQKAEYLSKIRAEGINEFEDLSPEVAEDYKERVALGQGMLRKMFDQSYDLDRRYRPVGVETKFEVPILSEGHKGEQLWCKCNRCWRRWKNSAEGAQHHDSWQESLHADMRAVALDEGVYRDMVWKGLPLTLGGRIDAIFQDEYGRYWIVDWKTAARLSTGEPGSPDDFLFMDDQITSYCWALWVLGIDVAGFIYHEQKKAMPEVPEPLKRSYKGALFSQNKQKDYEYPTYKKTVEENDPSGFLAGVYDDYLEYLRTEGGVYYKRHVVHRNTAELVAAGTNLAAEALDMVDPNLRIYPNPGRFACNGCAFREPCMGMNRGEDYQYTLETLFEQRTTLYWETAEPNTDKPSRD